MAPNPSVQGNCALLSGPKNIFDFKNYLEYIFPLHFALWSSSWFDATRRKSHSKIDKNGIFEHIWQDCFRSIFVLFIQEIHRSQSRARFLVSRTTAGALPSSVTTALVRVSHLYFGCSTSSSGVDRPLHCVPNPFAAKKSPTQHSFPQNEWPPSIPSAQQNETGACGLTAPKSFQARDAHVVSKIITLSVNCHLIQQVIWTSNPYNFFSIFLWWNNRKHRHIFPVQKIRYH